MKPSASSRPGSSGPGRIVVVGTPIGNLGDFSARGAAAVASADVLFCEDTRRTRKLLSASGIKAPRLVSMHQHNEMAAAEYALRLAEEGSVVAVVTDGGMPAISDPGEVVVRLAGAAGVPVEVVPGPSAVIAALVASGFPARRFCFEGFLPRKGRDRRERLAAMSADDRTCVIYEAPHRVVKTLSDLASACGEDRPVAAARELTKVHEEVWRGTLGDALRWVGTTEPRGEWVLVLSGRT